MTRPARWWATSVDGACWCLRTRQAGSQRARGHLLPPGTQPHDQPTLADEELRDQLAALASGAPESRILKPMGQVLMITSFSGAHPMQTDFLDLVIAKRLLDHLKALGFQFQRTALGEDGPLVGYRISDDYLDLIHIEGFSRDCFAWRKRASSLIVPGSGLVERQADGSALDVLNEVLTWQTD